VTIAELTADHVNQLVALFQRPPDSDLTFIKEDVLDPSCFAVFGRCRWSVSRGDTPMAGGSWILGCEEDSIDRSFTVLVRVVRRCLPAPPHRARWPVS
jgi:hypothetical protein